jgi:hypothetical protein
MHRGVDGSIESDGCAIGDHIGPKSKDDDANDTGADEDSPVPRGEVDVDVGIWEQAAVALEQRSKWR